MASLDADVDAEINTGGSVDAEIEVPVISCSAAADVESVAPQADLDLVRLC